MEQFRTKIEPSMHLVYTVHRKRCIGSTARELKYLQGIAYRFLHGEVII
jgi:hypothetical protein